jgi:hypothetical protein
MFDLTLNDSIGIIVKPYKELIRVKNDIDTIYLRNCQVGECVKINLPYKGKIIIEGANLVKKCKLTTYQVHQLPTFQRFGKLKKFTIIRDNANPSPAIVYRKKAIIICNDKFFSYPTEWQNFILLHEYGHIFYKDETGADTYALNQMALQGKNLSQAYYCLLNTLQNSPLKTERLNSIKNYIFNIKKNNN